MNRNPHNLLAIIIVLGVIMILSGCSLSQSTIAPTPTYPLSKVVLITPGIITTPKEYDPNSPEATVVRFLSGFPDNLEIMVNALSASVRDQLPAEGPAALLQISGNLEGYSVLGGSYEPNPPSASVSVILQVGGVNQYRKFTLIKPGIQWVIDSIAITGN